MLEWMRGRIVEYLEYTYRWRSYMNISETVYEHTVVWSFAEQTSFVRILYTIHSDYSVCWIHTHVSICSGKNLFGTRTTWRRKQQLVACIFTVFSFEPWNGASRVFHFPETPSGILFVWMCPCAFDIFFLLFSTDFIEYLYYLLAFLCSTIDNVAQHPASHYHPAARGQKKEREKRIRFPFSRPVPFISILSAPCHLIESILFDIQMEIWWRARNWNRMWITSEHFSLVIRIQYHGRVPAMATGSRVSFSTTQFVCVVEWAVRTVYCAYHNGRLT